MSIEIWQFPQSATRDQLIALLLELGYVQGENLFSPGLPGTVSFFWQESGDFKSTNGVDASVFPLDDNAKEVWKTITDWAVRTRTSLGATSFDQEFQNYTVRCIRKKFGGTFYNDCFGHNRYNVITRELSTPASRGLHGVLTKLLHDLESLEQVLPEETMKSLHTPQGEITEETDQNGLLQLIQKYDPSRVIYNALIPFLVAVIEDFFRECFEILLKYDSSTMVKLEDQTRKLSLAEVKAISMREPGFERIVSSWYSFQNINGIQKAYSEILCFDIGKILSHREQVRDKLPIMSKWLENLIETRHGVIHHFSLNRGLDRETFLDLIHFVRALLQVVSEGFEQKLGIKLGPG